MYKIFCISLICTFLFHSCVKEEPEPEPEPEIPEEPAFAEATIGPEGGELASEDFILSVPEGAIDTTLTFKLLTVDESLWENARQVTGLYQLEGLNGEITKPLKFIIRYEGTLDEENAIALGYTYFDEESGDSVRVNELLSAEDSAGFLVGSLVPMELEDTFLKSANMVDPAAHPMIFHCRLMIRGWSGIKICQSEYAEIRYDPTFNFSREKVQQFAQFMDEAVYFFDALKVMDRSVFEGYRFRVNILVNGAVDSHPYFVTPDLGEVNFMQLTETFKKLTKVYSTNLDGDYFAAADEMKLRMIAAEGVLRFENYCYFGKMDHWLQFAILNWAKRYFLGSYPLYSDDNLSYVALMQPFHGMNADLTRPGIFPFKDRQPNYIFHGEGMSPLIRYLSENYNEDLELLYKIYMEMMDPREPDHPIDILLATIETPENIWWPEFFKAYLEGKIWEIPVYRFQEKIDANDRIEFATEDDTVKYLDRMYPDLSARLFQVTFDDDFSGKVLGDGDKLRFKLEPKGVNPDYVRVMVHSFDGAQPVLIGEGNEVVIDDLKAFIDGGNRALLVTVVNSGNEPPYKEEMEIQLTARVEQKKTWSWKYVSIEAVADAILRSNTGDDTNWDDFTFNVSDMELNMNEEGTLLYTTWVNQNSDFKYEGGIDINIDPATLEITGFYLWSNAESYSEGMISLSERTEIEGKEGIRIPVVYRDGDYLYHELSGSSVCQAIESWSYKYALYPGQSYEYTNNLISYSCVENASLQFFWSGEGGSEKRTRLGWAPSLNNSRVQASFVINQ